MDKNLSTVPKLILNDSYGSFYKELTLSLQTCKKFYFSVAFINYSGLQLLIDEFNNLSNKNINGKIITSTYLNFTDVNSLIKLKQYKNIDTRIYIANQSKGFHTKGYIFEYDDYYKIIVGSSNITQSAFKSNVEWNVEYLAKKSDQFSNKILDEFNNLWNETDDINDAFIEQYSSFMKTMEEFVKKERSIFDYSLEIKPNKMQLEALKNLSILRKNNQNKALIIAATGTGKTYLAAFDAKEFNPKRMLFIAHRNNILSDAKRSFAKVITNPSLGEYTSKNKIANYDYTFAMIQTLTKDNNLLSFKPNDFDYIVIDEAHRSYSKTYQKVIKYFKPQFLLGMTATPERTDGGNIFALFNNNIGLEVRLRDALKEDLIVPFHYFGISDTTADLSNLDDLGIDEIAQKLSIGKRVDLVIENIEKYGHDGRKRKCLAFCATKAHAKYMAEEFNGFDYPSIHLTGENSIEDRELAIKELEDESNKLEFIFTVDIFNEGIDIPSINLVLMLRPTQSPIIFTQQLGRGLRKHDNKLFLTVLDFIGNHNKSFLIPIALSGSRYYDKDGLKVTVYNDFDDLPGCSNISLDRVAKENILKQLELVSFNSLIYLKKEYQQFKFINGNKIPTILDFIHYEAAPDPVKFIKNSDSYYEFINKMENRSNNNENEEILKFIRRIDKALPLKRINEFVILKKLFEDSVSLSLNSAIDAILKLIDGVDDESVLHSFSYYNSDFHTDKEENPYKMISKEQELLKMDEGFKNKVKNSIYYELVMNSLDYGILRYQEEFGKNKLSYPYLKLYNNYKMNDMGLLTNYNKSHSSIRGQGVWSYKNNRYFFVDLHKDESIKEAIKYKDKIIDRYNFQWETPNNTTQDSDRGKDIIFHKKRGINLHLFLKKAKIIGKQKLDYIYVGKIESISFEGERPITFQMKFLTPLSKFVFNDLTKRV